MAVNFACDWCGKHMATVTRAQMKDYTQTHEDICKECVEKRELLKTRLEDFKTMWDKAFAKFKQNAEEDLAREIRQIADGS